ncbi:ribosome maturation factor RimM [Methylotenera mobilis]|uniref:Ribosome maturation factor RimM n=1 Tax=Methylotenera mobilis (strain JLW8 / ATCC BAA-1282 / DSM 17540) TaxID=583345 RepID=C6WZ27_METML|nr:ribosome maturation factor RimM [Methylotenera mobilis]ACT48975.1 16S rRNA processing protein RimM [Methylotenera mobilis JLW8]
MAVDNMVVMGRIVAPYGVYGWLKVVPDTEAIDGLFDYDSWWLGKGDDWREMVVETAKIHNDVIVVKLVGIDDRDAAFACKGKQIAVPRAQLPEPDENEYYWSDLVGLRVTNSQGVDFGVITEVFETGANDVLVVKPDALVKPDSSAKADSKAKSDAVPVEAGKDKPQERLIPFVADVVLTVDLEAKSMLVDWDEDF